MDGLRTVLRSAILGSFGCTQFNCPPVNHIPLRIINKTINRPK